MTNIDDVAQTLAEYERLAVTSGAAVQIDPPEYSDGLSVTPWTPFWIHGGHPKVARATVRRDGIPTTVYASWDESLPMESAQTDDGRLWRDIWEQKPMERFGSFVVRAALRRAFREVIGERVEADEDAPKVGTPATPAHDWEAEIEAAPTAEAVNALHAEMKRARAVTPDLELQLRNRLTAAAWAPSETPDPPRMNDHTVVAPGNVPGIRPQDHLPPTNRAARRAGKGRRK